MAEGGGDSDKDFIDDEAAEAGEEEEEDENEDEVDPEDDDDYTEMDRNRKAKRTKGAAVDGKKAPASKKAPLSARYFVDDEASDAGEEEDELAGEDDRDLQEEAEAAAAESDLLEEETPGERPHPGLLPPPQGRQNRKTSYGLQQDLQNNVSMEDIVRNIESRTRDDLADLDEVPAGEVMQHNLLPSVNDPKLWVVKCKIGKERELVIGLMQRYLEKRETIDALQIKSAIAPDNVKGYFYVEAEKEAHAVAAVNGLSNVFHQKLKLVPIKEMADVLSVTASSVASLCPNDWVRVTRGLYKGDLAQVVEVDEPRGRITVRLIPRLDIVAIREGATGDDDDDEGRRGAGAAGAARGKRAATHHVPARFFNPEEFTGMAAKKKDHSTGVDFWLFNGMRFEDGYLIKTMNLQSVDSNNVNPSLDELRQFQRREDGEIDVAALARARPRRGALFVKGDLVQVVDGDLKHLMGVVDSVDGTNVNIMPQHEDLHDLLTLPAVQLQKYFRAGDHVKVISGRFDGETGLVVQAEGTTAVILSDVSQKEVSVLTQDLQECTEVGAARAELGSFRLGDLVQLSATPQTVGVIVKIERASFKVLDNTGKLLSVPLQQMGPKRNNPHTEMTLDCNQKPLSVGELVSVIDGPNKGRQGTIRHIFRYFVFIYSRDYSDNGGIYVSRAHNVTLLGGSNPFLHQTGRGGGPGGRGTTWAGRSWRGSAPGGNFRGGGRGRGARRDLSDIGKTVIIRGGCWKGYVGIVKDVTDATARVELQAKGKQVTVPRELIKSDTGDYDRVEDFSTPRTPHVPMTPRGSRTPGRVEDGAIATPSRTPLTPSHDPWNPNNPNTPAHMSTPATDYNTGEDWETGPSNAYAYSPAPPTPAGGPIPTPGTAPQLPVTPSLPPMARTPASSYMPPSSQLPSTPGPVSTPGAYVAPTPTTGDIIMPATPAMVAPTPGTAPSSYKPTTPYGTIADPSPMLSAPTPCSSMMTLPSTPYAAIPTPTPGTVLMPTTPGPMLSASNAAEDDGVYRPPMPTTPATPAAMLLSSQNPPTPAPSTPQAPVGDVEEEEEDSADADPSARLPAGAEVAVGASASVGRVVGHKQDTGLVLIQMRNVGETADWSEQVVEVPLAHVTAVVPSRRDQVLVVRGQFRGSQGELVNVSRSDGIVRMLPGADVRVLPLSSLVKKAVQ
eukprot:TRINITY_DN7567_c0_g1_i1.p1 TRINITY_DN7567_c0_g1~~TRINITY_DN7567_c0_g1_i1.p1  ORF type:complete len:1185 (-),score=297.14 TRINITY_DN7567_c0_g1_i1:62-3595(-)